MLREYNVYEGLWEKYNQPILRRWIWTLGNLNAIIVLAALGLLLTFTQSRIWVNLRYLILLRNEPVSLGSETLSEPLEHLSKGTAVREVIPFIRYHGWNLTQRVLRKQRHQPEIRSKQHSPVISPVFGLAALLNFGVFITLGVAIPCLISEGTLGDALVKSKLTKTCLAILDDGVPSLVWSPANGLHETDAVFQLCQRQIEQDCDQRLYLQRPQIGRRRLKMCLFPGHICYDGSNSFEITHMNITPYELGINSRSSMTMDHRLTCSPIYLDSFLVPGPNYPTRVRISTQGVEFDGKPYDDTPLFVKGLNTMNERKQISNETSGTDHLPEKWPMDLTILPTLLFRENHSVNIMDYIHPDLRRNDGLSFLVINRPGGTIYFSKVDDPFYSAHTPCHYGNMTGYCPDNEATALGCLEQYQYCTKGSGFCTGWGLEKEQFFGAKHFLEGENDMLSLMDLWVFEIARDSLSVHSYLSKRQEDYRPLPLIRKPLTKRTGDEDETYTNEEWIAEVETWFRKDILEAIFRLQEGRRHEMQRSFEYHANHHLAYNSLAGKRYSSCDRILFQNSQYTNINWVGFCLIVALLSLLCITSYAVNWLHRKASLTVKMLNGTGKFLWTKIVQGSSTLKSFTRFKNSRNVPMFPASVSENIPPIWTWSRSGSNVRTPAPRFDEEITDGAISLQSHR